MPVPALDGVAFDEPAGGGAVALVPAAVAFLLPLPGAFLLDVEDGQPQQLDHRVVAGEVPPVLDDLSELVVEALLGYLERRERAGR